MITARRTGVRGSAFDPVDRTSEDADLQGAADRPVDLSRPCGPPGRSLDGPALAGHGAEAVRDAIACKIATLPAQLRRSLTWDQGAEMARHAELSIETGLSIFFCDPHSPWQRGSNENTNGLLRQYFPKDTDLAAHDAADLDAVAHALNTRPRKTLGWRTPAEALDGVLREAQKAGVATTG